MKKIDLEAKLQTMISELVDKLDMTPETMEDERNRILKEIERLSALEQGYQKNKTKFDWATLIIGLTTALVPLGIKILVRDHEIRMMYDFEEHGRLTGSASKQISRLIDLGRD